LSKIIGNCPTVKYVIYDGAATKKDEVDALQSIKNANKGEGGEGVRVVTLDELKELGRKENHAPVPPTEKGELISFKACNVSSYT